MSFPTLPQSVSELDLSQWATFAPYFDELRQRTLAPQSPSRWLRDWSDVSRLFYEGLTQTYIHKSLDTTDESRERAYLTLVSDVLPPHQVADQALKERLLSLEVSDPSLALVVRNMRNEADLFREENIPLFTELQKLANEYDKITGGLTADWDGETKNISQLEGLLRQKARPVRERAWRTMMDLWLGCREALDEIYVRMLARRERVAANAGLPDYRAYAFRQRGRFDYTPEDCLTFHDAIEAVVAPAAERVLARKRDRLALPALRPWDRYVEPGDAPLLRPYKGQAELVAHARQMFHQIDPELGRYFDVMAEESLLDLDTRPGKALGGYCSHLYWRRRPFIFMNGSGLHDDVQTLLHEAGHAFHAFESDRLPYIWQGDTPMEFSEVASMAMELLAAPYLTRDRGGFYTPAEAARARIEHLEGILLFLPYMAVVDAFQHWVYTHPAEASQPANLDAAWDGLWSRFMGGVDWRGLDAERMTGWHRKPHIFESPFYYIEYGMAQVGALQIWRNSLADHAGALQAYRQALALGGTRSLPELFAAAGAAFRFDTEMLAGLVELIEATVDDLEQSLT